MLRVSDTFDGSDRKLACFLYPSPSYISDKHSELDLSKRCCSQFQLTGSCRKYQTRQRVLIKMYTVVTMTGEKLFMQHLEHLITHKRCSDSFLYSTHTHTHTHTTVPSINRFICGASGTVMKRLTLVSPQSQRHSDDSNGD